MRKFTFWAIFVGGVLGSFCDNPGENFDELIVAKFTVLRIAQPHRFPSTSFVQNLFHELPKRFLGRTSVGEFLDCLEIQHLQFSKGVVVTGAFLFGPNVECARDRAFGSKRH